MKLHERLLRMRTELGSEGKPLSLAQLGTKAGLSKAALTRVDRESRAGSEVGEKALRRCAEFWGYSVDWLISGRGEPRQKSLGAFDQALAAEEWDTVAIAAVKAKMAKGIGEDWSSARWQTELRAFHEFSQAKERAPDEQERAKPARIKRF